VAGLRKRRRIQLIFAGLALLFAAVALVGFAMRDGIEFFRAPVQVMQQRPADGERFRLGGLVKEGSWVKGPVNRFVITDLTADVPVEYEGITPALFAEGQGTIVRGSLRDGVFVADEVLAKHDENYMPREVIDALKEQGIYQPSD
jgi:cytochrome c-type biogenesis protein CcmE